MTSSEVTKCLPGSEQQAGQETRDALKRRDLDIAALQRQIEHGMARAARCEAESTQLRQLVSSGLQQSRDIRLITTELKAALQKETERRVGLEQRESHLQLELETARTDAQSARDNLDAVFSSTSWRLTAGLRLVGTAVRKTRTATQLVRQGQWNVFGSRLRQMVAGARPDVTDTSADVGQIASPDPVAMRSSIIRSGALRGTRQVGIMATPHTLFVAHNIARALDALDIRSTITTESPACFDADLYFVVCPQMFSELPPAEKRIAVQMEQSVSSRWFTKEYLDVLRNSLGVLDYSRRNLAFLESHDCGYPAAFHVPIGGSDTYGAAGEAPAVDDGIDVLFYGDDKTPRRQQILQALSKDFRIHVASNVFGSELHRLVRSARVVLNIHYYENSLLETTRIYECLSLGVPVVSEEAVDQDEHHMLQGAVQFAPMGDVEALARALRHALDETSAHECVAGAIRRSQDHFNFMFMRALLALNVISYEQLVAHTSGELPMHARMALSLPETTARRALFEAEAPPSTRIFDGLRASPGWKGCGMSYKFLATQALHRGLDQLTICEDDVELGAQAFAMLRTAERYLKEREGRWDIFAGLIADLHADTEVLDVEEFEGVTFVTLNKMTSMVYNIYSRGALNLLKRWDPRGDDVMVDTIDRYLERTSSLRTVTTLPFAVGHREEADSSLWGVSNQVYNAVISRSEQLLAAKVLEFKVTRALSQEDAWRSESACTVSA